jgi:thioredoxin 1
MGEKPMLTDTQNAVVHADEKTFRKEVLNSEVPVLVDFYADWCGPCRLLGPVLEELAQETPDAKIVKVNVDESPQLAEKYGVRSIPNLLVFKDGQVVDQQVGVASKQQLKSLLAE